MERSVRLWNRFFFVTGMILLGSEAGKQLLLTFSVGKGHYLWWYFPFQLCSIPMYLLPLLPFLKGEKRRCVLAFLSTLTLLGAMAAVPLLPLACCADSFRAGRRFLPGPGIRPGTGTGQQVPVPVHTKCPPFLADISACGSALRHALPCSHGTESYSFPLRHHQYVLYQSPASHGTDCLPAHCPYLGKRGRNPFLCGVHFSGQCHPLRVLAAAVPAFSRTPAGYPEPALMPSIQ